MVGTASAQRERTNAIGQRDTVSWLTTPLTSNIEPLLYLHDGAAIVNPEMTDVVR